MMQQVNLFRPQFATSPTAFGWRSLLWLLLIAVLAMSGISAYGYLQQRELQRQTASIERQLNQLRGGLARLSQGIASAQADPHRAAARERLRRHNLEAGQFFQALSRLSRQEPGEFSAYFRGLARQTISGLWLEEMQVDAGGQALLLRGQALEPSLIPRFLQALRDEPSFAGHAFAEVEFQRQVSARDEAARREAVRFQFKSIAGGDGGGKDG